MNFDRSAVSLRINMGYVDKTNRMYRTSTLLYISSSKTCDFRGMAIFDPRRHNLNNLGRGSLYYKHNIPRRVAQLVTCLATDASLTADQGVASLIPTLSHTFVEIDHEIISTFILLPSAESFKKGCCQLQVKVCAQSTG